MFPDILRAMKDRGHDPDRLYGINTSAESKDGFPGETGRLLRFFRFPMSPAYLLRNLPCPADLAPVLLELLEQEKIVPVEGFTLQMTVAREQWDFYKGLDDSSYPTEVQLNITNRCINRCRTCRKYEWEQVDMEPEKFRGIIEELQSMSDPLLILSGGEPFLHRDIDTLLDVVESMRTMVFTSGAVPVSVGKLRKVKSVQFSVDALDPEIYRAIRGPGSVEVLKENISKAKEAGCIVTVTSVIQRDNIFHIPDIIEFCAREGIPFLPGAVHSYDDMAFYNLYKRPLPPLCVVPYYHCLIDASGDIFVCCHHYEDNTDYRNIDRRFVLGNAFSEGFAAAWFSDRAKEIKRWLLENRAGYCRGCFRYLLQNDVASRIRCSGGPKDLPFIHAYHFPLEIMRQLTVSGQ